MPEKLLHLARRGGVGLDEDLGGARVCLRRDVLDGNGLVGAQAEQREAIREVGIAIGDEVASAGLGEPERNALICLLLRAKRPGSTPRRRSHAQAELLGDGRGDVNVDAHRLVARVSAAVWRVVRVDANGQNALVDGRRSVQLGSQVAFDLRVCLELTRRQPDNGKHADGKRHDDCGYSLVSDLLCEHLAPFVMGQWKRSPQLTWFLTPHSHTETFA